jgi:hypothetical protein
MVHGDLCGLIKPTTPGGKKLFLLLVDDFSGFMWLVLLLSTDEAADVIKRVRANLKEHRGGSLAISGLTGEANSSRQTSSSIALRQACEDSSRRPTHHIKMVW